MKRPRRETATARGLRELRAALAADVPGRLERLRDELDARRLDAILVTSAPNVHYLSGFTGDESALLVGTRAGTRGKTGGVLVTDARFEEEAAGSAPKAKVVIRKGPLIKECVRQARARGWRRLGFELTGLLAVDRDDLAREARAVRGKRLTLKGIRGLVEALRQLKSRSEVEAIRRAVRLAEAAGRMARSYFRAGRSELDVARRVARRMEDLGASEASFPTIAAFDARSSLPHAKPTDAVARAKSFLLLDWGARADFYCSDLTRVFAQNSIPAWLRRAHSVVHEAARAAVERAGPGVRARDVDSAAREVIRKAGWGREFRHGLGHGLGLEVHEAPRLGPGSPDVLRAGMVVTIEPGVYFPGRGGVRIEDDVLVTDDGAERLSGLPRCLR